MHRSGRYHTQTVSSLRIGPRPFLLLCRITLATVVLNVVTGAAVRLSDSGLGCPDWPTCSQHHLTPPLRLHPLIEFGNRVVVFLLVVACCRDRGRRLPAPARPGATCGGCPAGSSSG